MAVGGHGAPTAASWHCRQHRLACNPPTWCVTGSIGLAAWPQRQPPARGKFLAGERRPAREALRAVHPSPWPARWGDTRRAAPSHQPGSNADLLQPAAALAAWRA